METRNTHLILFSAAFLVLGFLLGRVTGHKGMPRPHGHAGCMQWTEEGILESQDVEVMILSDGDFQGDTVISLPGIGTVNVMSNGEDVEVEVEATVGEEIEREVRHVQVTKEASGDSDIRVEKRVVVVRSDE